MNKKVEGATGEAVKNWENASIHPEKSGGVTRLRPDPAPPSRDTWGSIFNRARDNFGDTPGPIERIAQIQHLLDRQIRSLFTAATGRTPASDLTTDQIVHISLDEKLIDADTVNVFKMVYSESTSAVSGVLLPAHSIKFVEDNAPKILIVLQTAERKAKAQRPLSEPENPDAGAKGSDEPS